VAAAVVAYPYPHPSLAAAAAAAGAAAVRPSHHPSLVVEAVAAAAAGQMFDLGVREMAEKAAAVEYRWHRPSHLGKVAAALAMRR
jgi:hypothetical protein